MKTTFILFLTLTSAMLSFGQTYPLGIFDGSTDVGSTLPGDAVYDVHAQEYTVSGSGKNIWFDRDAFHFLWKKMSGDFILRTQARFIGTGVDPHRKVGWMVRNTLDSTSAQVTAVVHGDGLTSLQYRKSDATNMLEQKSPLNGADVIQLERNGNHYYMSVAKNGELFVLDSVSVDLNDDVYVGLFVCAHNPKVVEKAIFDNVRIVVPAPADLVPYRQYLGSQLEILDVATGKSEIILQSARSIQAPNWLADDKHLIYNSEGLIYKLNMATLDQEVLNTGAANKNNNDHVLSFDGKMLGLSSGSVSQVYTVPIAGGEPKQITKNSKASYLHGWSPNGKSLVFVGNRNDNYDIYRIPAKGGKEVRLTDAPGLDDGCEYSPDGQYIYFNSVRTGTMEIWRMKADGSDQKQLTNDVYNNWFPHVSPDGKWLAFVSFGPEVPAGDHPFYQRVYLRVMPAEGGDIRVISYLYGGQGTMNTPSWSPDSKKLAFISNSNFLPPVFPMEKK